MKKKIAPMLFAIALIFVVLGLALGSKVLEKLSYSKEKADLREYLGISADDEVAIVLNDWPVDEKAKHYEDMYYFTLSTVENYFCDRFYVNSIEQVLLFTTDTDVIRINIGDESNIMYVSDNAQELGYKAAFYEGDTLYIAAGYIQKFANMEWTPYTYNNDSQSVECIDVRTTWDSYNLAKLSKKQALRVKGGIKSEVVIELNEGDTVYILEEMENWSRVKSENAFTGYIENKYLKNKTPGQYICSSGFEEITYNSVKKEGVVNLGFHQVFNDTGVDGLTNVLSGTKGINVIAPTWFRLRDNAGNISSLANASYVQKAHEMGIDVWGLVTEVDSEELYGLQVDFVELLSSSANRKNLIASLMAEVDKYGLDGINIDFEKVKKDSGIHFVQFLRELSVETGKRGIVLSVDNFVPTEYTAHYNRKEQGIICDYIIIMGYDEHYVGGGEAGSVASINYVENGIINTKNVVPADKIINAIPFYTRVWESSNDGLKASTLTMQNQNSWISQANVTPVWNDSTCQNYAEYQIDGTLYQCWLEDVDSIRVKLQTMKAQEIAGVASWKLGIEDKAVWDVIYEYMQ